MPLSTLRTWFFGYPSQALPVIEPADPKKRLLSFVNLIEAHILYSIRKDRDIPLTKVRKAIHYIQKTMRAKHPLTEKFATSGRDLFVENLGKLIGVGQDGQIAMQDILKLYLQRIEWDEAGLAKTFYPYVRQGVPESQQPHIIQIDPTISGGRPVLVGTGIPTRVVAERHFAGESIDDLAKDYNRTRAEIEEILRCETRLAA
jgi:uncharacterized protein (DUF433 family)